jgi:tRNA(adenine34) deaminase
MNSISQKKIDESFMREALKEAKIASDSGNWPVGCVLVLDDVIISRGHNQVYSGSSKIKHAEMIAIENASSILCDRGGEVTAYLTYEPCPMCLGAILLNHFKRVVCGPDLDGSGAMFLRNHMPARFAGKKCRFKLTTGVLQEECRKMFMSGAPVNKLIKQGIIDDQTSQL